MPRGQTTSDEAASKSRAAQQVMATALGIADWRTLDGSEPSKPTAGCSRDSTAPTSSISRESLEPCLADLYFDTSAPALIGTGEGRLFSPYYPESS